MYHHEIARMRLVSQRLAGNVASNPEEALRWLCAAQSQDYHAAKWGLAQRAQNVTSSCLDELFNQGRLLRTHVMRPTWHFVLPEDIRWLLDLTAARVHTANGHPYRRLELDDGLLRRCQDLLAEALQGGKQLTRNELGGVLAQHGINATANRLAYVIMFGELNAVLCSGALRGKQFTYALLDERVPPAPGRERDEALAELAMRYFHSHGPATPHDFAWWSGLTVRECRIAVQLVGRDLDHATVEGKTYWFAPGLSTPRFEDPAVHLLPNYDEHIVAYRDHTPSFDIRVLPSRGPYGDALTAHIITLDGHVIGGWRRTISRSGVTIAPTPLLPLTAQQRSALESAASAYGAFLSLPAGLTPPKPSPSRPRPTPSATAPRPPHIS